MRRIVDGMNVIGSRPTGWWRDRARAMRELVERLDAFGDDLTVVFDGRPRDVGEPAHVRVHFAPGGRNAADDAIVELVAADDDPAGLLVVTSDRELAERVRAAGAQVEAAGAFLRALENR